MPSNFERAKQVLDRRRETAEREAEQRTEELELLSPELRALNRKLSAAGLKAVQLGVYRVEAVADVREIRPGAAEGHKGEVQYVVGAVGYEYILPRYPVARRQRVPKPDTNRIGVQLQTFCGFLCVFLCFRRRRERRFVGIEFDQILNPRLFSRGIRGQRGVVGGEKSAHMRSPYLSSRRMTALFACAVRPSCLAKYSTSRATRSSAS